METSRSEHRRSFAIREFDPDRLVSDVVPGVGGLPGTPDWRDMPALAQMIGRRLQQQPWSEVANLTVGDLLAMPSVGLKKVDAFIEYLEDLVRVPREAVSAGPSRRLHDRAAAAAQSARLILSSIVEEAIEWDIPDLLTAVEESLASDSPDGTRNRLHAIALPRVEIEDWLDDIRSVRSTFEDRKLEILDARVLTDSTKGRPTLQELADRYGLTRERVRQIESAAVEALDREVSNRGYLGLRHAIRSIKRLGIAFPMSELPLIEHDPEARRLLLWAAGPFGLDDGWAVLVEYASLSNLALAAFERVAVDGIAPRFDFLESLFDLGVNREHHGYVASTIRVQEIGDSLIRPAGTLAERAVQRLTVLGRPMSIDELLEGEDSSQNARSFANAVQASAEIVRTGKDRYELAAWGGSAYIGIVPAMVDRLRIRDPEPISITDLAQELADRYGVAENSIHMYATMHPKFLAENGEVRLRPSDVPYEPEVDLVNTSACYLIDGHWSLRMLVDKDLGRGSGRALPEAFAVHLGLQPSDSRGQLHGPAGEISVGWGMAPWVGSLRREAKQLGLVEGDYLFMRRVSATSVEFQGCQIGPDADTVTRLRALIGVVASDGDWRYDLAEALGVGAATEPDARFLLRRLRQRGDDELAGLVEELID